jgi:hypothetical protein
MKHTLHILFIIITFRFSPSPPWLPVDFAKCGREVLFCSQQAARPSGASISQAQRHDLVCSTCKVSASFKYKSISAPFLLQGVCCAWLREWMASDVVFEFHNYTCMSSCRNILYSRGDFINTGPIYRVYTKEWCGFPLFTIESAPFFCV